jgi:hypothetical protein
MMRVLGSEYLSRLLRLLVLKGGVRADSVCVVTLGSRSRTGLLWEVCFRCWRLRVRRAASDGMRVVQ